THPHKAEPPPTEVLSPTIKPSYTLPSPTLPPTIPSPQIFTPQIREERRPKRRVGIWLLVIGVIGILFIGLVVLIIQTAWSGISNSAATKPGANSALSNTSTATSSATPQRQSTPSPAALSLAERLGMVGVWRRTDGAKVEVKK